MPCFSTSLSKCYLICLTKELERSQLVALGLQRKMVEAAERRMELEEAQRRAEEARRMAEEAAHLEKAEREAKVRRERSRHCRTHRRFTVIVFFICLQESRVTG